MKITAEYLKTHPNEIFVFGDNTIRKGYGGAAKLRDHPNTFGFITKKYPNNQDASFFRPDEYLPIFNSELERLMSEVNLHLDKVFLITPIGSGLANRYNIFEQIIEPQIKSTFINSANVVLLF